jgi:hypothetical protein
VSILRAAIATQLALAVLGAHAQPTGFATPPDQERFLINAPIVSAPPTAAPPRPSFRVTLADETGKHDAGVETAAGDAPNGRDYRRALAAYALDQTLALDFVPPTVARNVFGKQAAVTWWIANLT